MGQSAGTTVIFVRDRFARSVPAQLSQAQSVPWFSQVQSVSQSSVSAMSQSEFSQCHALYKTNLQEWRAGFHLEG